MTALPVLMSGTKSNSHRRMISGVKKKVFLRCVHPEHSRFLEITDSDNRNYDYSLSHIIALRQTLSEGGFLLTTRAGEEDVSIELHENAFNNRIYPRLPLLGYAVETEYFYPLNYDLGALRQYDRFFHFDENFIEAHPFLEKTTEPRHLSKEYFDFTPLDWFERDLFIVNISSNKNFKVYCPQNGYDIRYHLLRYFAERYNSSNRYKCVLYGDGWRLPRKKSGFLNHYGHRVRELLLRKFSLDFGGDPAISPIYRGVIERKEHALGRAKFALAIENVFYRKGYVTEKIFDSIRCGAIPIVKGAPSTSFDVPDGLFINLDNFSDYENLAKFLESFDDTAYRAWAQKRTDFIIENNFRNGTSREWACNIFSTIKKYC